MERSFTREGWVIIKEWSRVLLNKAQNGACLKNQMCYKIKKSQHITYGQKSQPTVLLKTEVIVRELKVGKKYLTGPRNQTKKDRNISH